MFNIIGGFDASHFAPRLDRSGIAVPKRLGGANPNTLRPSVASALGRGVESLGWIQECLPKGACGRLRAKPSPRRSERLSVAHVVGPVKEACEVIRRQNADFALSDVICPNFRFGSFVPDNTEPPWTL